MSELDLVEAERAVRLELARVIERGIKADIGEYAVMAALPEILKAFENALVEDRASGRLDANDARTIGLWLRAHLEDYL